MAGGEAILPATIAVDQGDECRDGVVRVGGTETSDGPTDDMGADLVAKSDGHTDADEEQEGVLGLEDPEQHEGQEEVEGNPCEAIGDRPDDGVENVGVETIAEQKDLFVEVEKKVEHLC